MVTLLAWIAHRFVSSNRPTRYASLASCSKSTRRNVVRNPQGSSPSTAARPALSSTCSAPMAALWNLKSVLKSWAISLTSRWKGSLRISNSVDF